MLGKMLSRFTLPLLLLVASIPGSSIAQPQKSSASADSGVLQKMLAVKGNAEMNLDLNRISKSGGSNNSQLANFQFQVAANSFFTVLVFNDQLRGPDAGSLGLVSRDAAKLPAALHIEQLVVEKQGPEEAFSRRSRWKNGIRLLQYQRTWVQLRCRNEIVKVSKTVDFS